MTIDEINDPAIPATTLLERWYDSERWKYASIETMGLRAYDCVLVHWGNRINGKADTIDAAIRVALRQWAERGGGK